MAHPTHTPKEVEWLCEQQVPDLVNDIMYAILAAKPEDIHLYLAKWAVNRLNETQTKKLLDYMGIVHYNDSSSSPRYGKSYGDTSAGRSPLRNKTLLSKGRGGGYIRQGANNNGHKGPTVSSLSQAGYGIRALRDRNPQKLQIMAPSDSDSQSNSNNGELTRSASLRLASRSHSVMLDVKALPDYEHGLLEWYYSYSQRSMLWHNLERYIRSGDDLAKDTLRFLDYYEMFFSYPGPDFMDQLHADLEGSLMMANPIAHSLEQVASVVEHLSRPPRHSEHNEFDVLIIAGDDCNPQIWHDELITPQNPGQDPLTYGLVIVSTFAEGLSALLMNGNIQSVIVLDEVIPTADLHSPLTSTFCAYKYLVERPLQRAQEGKQHEVLDHLITAIRAIRVELDIFLVSERPIYDSDMNRDVRRVFFARDDFYGELHAAILGCVAKRQKTPFFTALMNYASRPIGVFHAMAISRGSSLLKSNWISPFLNFYGMNIFRAESSATCGGLDSLLDPTGSLKQAQKKAAEAYGALATYFVTNGTSTANKIVLQALLAPNDIVVLDRDCHKSHHYGIIQTGATPSYLDAYPLHEYAMYGAVGIRDIKRKLLEYKRCGLLHKVKLIVLTNCTFDGIVYNVQGLMEQCLAIKPDLCFLWDEAWYAYASFHPVLKRRTGMGAANRMVQVFQAQEYLDLCRQFWDKYDHLMKSNEAADHEKLLDVRLYPKPKETKLRVYATQSTHKSLTSFRQGSMIHIYDQIFQGGTRNSFKEAYYTHTSTSPNYQILASLDVGRSQMQLEGFRFVMDMLGHAMYLRHHVGACKHLTKWIRFLDVDDLIPSEYRQCHGRNYFNKAILQVTRFEEAWLSQDEFVLDPTRLTLYTGETGINGNSFKVDWLMNKCDIQVNKTSRNSVLFQTNIGTSYSSTTFLVQSLRKCIYEFEKQHTASGGHLSAVWQAKVDSLTKNHALLPNFTSFHDAFRPKNTLGNEASMRDAFYLAFDENNCEYMTVRQARKRVEEQGEVITGTTFIIPYPPGFPIIMPGQIISVDILDYMQKLDVTEIHGYNPVQGLRVFKQEILAAHSSF